MTDEQIKAIHSAVLAIQVDPRITTEQKVAFLAGVHRAAAVVSQFAQKAASAAPVQEPTLICKSCGVDRFKEACKGDWLNCPFRGEAQASAAPRQKVMAYACIVDGAWHGAFKREIDAKEAGFETGKRFDLLPLCAAPSATQPTEKGKVCR